MIIRTPTSDLPAGLPGEVELAALANELFQKGLQAFSQTVSQAHALTPAIPRTVGLPDVSMLELGVGPVDTLARGRIVPPTALVAPSARAAGTAEGLIGRAIDTPADAQSRLEDLVRQATAALGTPQSPAATRQAAARTTSIAQSPGEAFHPQLVAAAPVGARAASGRHPGFEVEALRRDFPILQERVHGDRKLVWLDNAATTQKPQVVVDRLAHFYAHENSNIHRAAHELARRATDAYEDARAAVASFLGAGAAEEILFVRGATEAINLVANTVAAARLRRGDEILLSHLEHHGNIVPWQQVAERVGAILRVIPVDERGDLRLDSLPRLIGPRTRVVAFTHVSNALGTITPVREIVEAAHRAGAIVLLDGAQSVSHLPVDVRSLGVDFFVFSGHKLFGPTGIGAVYGSKDLLEELPPWQGGGNMIRDVTFERTSFGEPPERFEAGTGNIADAVGLAAAIQYLQSVGMDRIAAYESSLTAYGREALARVNGLSLLGNPRHHASVLSFTLEGHSNESVGRHLDQAGIAVRAGHHCAQPIHRRFGLESSVRASLVFYNTFEEIDYLVEVLGDLRGR